MALPLEQRVREYIQSHEHNNELLFIELARDDYQWALDKCFQQDFLQDSYFLFIEADVEQCIKRIHYRATHPLETDGHFISEHIMRGYYAKSNLEYICTRFQRDYNIQKEVTVIKNNGSYREFCDKLTPFAEVVFSASQTGIPAK